MVRKEVEELQIMGPFPSSKELIGSNLVSLQKYEHLLLSIEKPVTDEEADKLVRIFGVDDCFGLCWTLLHLIETAPNWSVSKSHVNEENEWVQMLKDREVRWRDAGYPARSFYSKGGLQDPKLDQS